MMRILWSPTAFAFAFMAIIASLYEPLRLALLHRVPQSFNIGGVGGVGGLANMIGNENGQCDSDDGSDKSSISGIRLLLGDSTSPFKDKYCYQKGSPAPFTPFAWLMLWLWVGPLLLAAVVTTLYARISNTSNRTPNNENRNSTPPLGVLATVWIGLNILWFIIPFSVFWFGLTNNGEKGGHEFVPGNNIALRILAVAIAASHPLSWNLMAAAIPASGITSKLLGIDRNTMFQCHRFISYVTVFWGVLHGFLELVYLGLIKGLAKRLFLQEDGEDILYLVGFIALLLIITQGVVGYCRKALRDKNIPFRKIHRGLAFALLLAAAMHWWPFIIFLIPVIAFHGVGIAVNRKETRNENTNDEDDKLSLSSIPDNLTTSQVTALMIVSILSSFFSTFIVWLLREAYMTSSVANLSLPFLFPFLSIILSLLFSVIASSLYLEFVIDENQDDDAQQQQQDLTTPLMEESGLEGTLELEGSGTSEQHEIS